jgi:ABC-type lipoprotein export system ATPase subunit
MRLDRAFQCVEELRGNPVLRDVNLIVREGEFISIRGKSGAGKTTLLKIIGMLE